MGREGKEGQQGIGIVGIVGIAHGGEVAGAGVGGEEEIAGEGELVRALASLAGPPADPRGSRLPGLPAPVPGATINRL